MLQVYIINYAIPSGFANCLKGLFANLLQYHLRDCSVSQCATSNLPCNVTKKSESKQSKGGNSPYTFALF